MWVPTLKPVSQPCAMVAVPPRAAGQLGLVPCPRATACRRGAAAAAAAAAHRSLRSYFLKEIALNSSVCLRMPISVGNRSMEDAP